MLSPITFRTRIAKAGIFLAALALLLYNGMALVKIYQLPATGASGVMKNAIATADKWSRIAAIEPPEVDLPPDIDYMLTHLRSASPLIKPERNTAKSNKAKHVPKPAEIKPPSLSGILQIGDHSIMALIEGMTLKVGDTVRGFQVSEVSAKGVTVKKGGTSWFLPMPQVLYSVDRGR